MSISFGCEKSPNTSNTPTIMHLFNLSLEKPDDEEELENRFTLKEVLTAIGKRKKPLL
jgi:hypothetical protein